MRGEISDGFGDDLTNAEVVANFRRWSYAVAGKTYGSSSTIDVDDLAQESMIAMWRVLEKKGGKAAVSATYLTQTGSMRMLAVQQGVPMTGGDSTPGPKYRPTGVVVDWNAVVSGDEDWGFEHLLEAADLLHSVDLAYHAGEIAECLNALAPADRAYVHARFWQGKTDTEIAAERGVSNKMLGTRWKRTIRPVLAERLAHLAGAL